MRSSAEARSSGTQSSQRQSDDLRQMLIDAKLTGNGLPEGGYYLRSNEQAADLALLVVAKWLKLKKDSGGNAQDHG